MLSCATIKAGRTCVFMRKSGCSYNGGKCHPGTESCAGCSNLEDLPAGQFCRIFAEPALKWNAGNCNMASHIQGDRSQEVTVKKVNPLKASKRAAR